MEIKAKYIVEMSDGDVSYSVAGKWLKNESPSPAVKYAMRYFELVIKKDSVPSACALLNESVEKVGGIDAAASIINKRAAANMEESRKTVDDLKTSTPSLKKASEIPAKPVVKIETTAWDSLPEGKSVGCRYNGEMTIDDLNDTESYVEVGKSGYKVLRAWTEFSLAGVRFERKDFKKK